MDNYIADKVIDFYNDLFGRIFSDTFAPLIQERLKRNAVLRQVQESADAASQSLTRLFLNEHLTQDEVVSVLARFSSMKELLRLQDIASSSILPEVLAETVLVQMPAPTARSTEYDETIHRVALQSIIQILMLVGPVMAEWQKLKFSVVFELPRRVVNRLNQISEQMDAIGTSGEAAADERYELSYRDYLLQRFHRVEAGTVRMTTNLDVDLRELFVMPRVSSIRTRRRDKDDGDRLALMNLATAREVFVLQDAKEKDHMPRRKGVTALQQVQRSKRVVLIGTPGVGKSTFMEWLQVKVAAVEEKLVLGGQQAIPVLLRVRQLDAAHLPEGAAIIEKATLSHDHANLMPYGWFERQMQNGRVLFMLDGLDETEPELRDSHIVPWLSSLCKRYPNCHYIVSSRPVGYPDKVFRSLKFAECDLLDFDDNQIQIYTHHWCTAIRLSRNEPEAEARRFGNTDGDKIVSGFKRHPYIRNLARNPLMLSAVCLVNYFEGGQLPKDRAVLYKLCVEGLLHNWDQRRGISSQFTLEEKLRTCRELALSMQSDDCAEYPAQRVNQIFAAILGSDRATTLLKHIRYRTGLLLERRPGIFGFAHLTFQEYLTAQAVHEGNISGTDVMLLVREHDDSRWQEVIPLYAGLATTRSARSLILQLLNEKDSLRIAQILADTFASAGPELAKDIELREKVIAQIAVSPATVWPSPLELFPVPQVKAIANACLGKGSSRGNLSHAHHWLRDHPDCLDMAGLCTRLSDRSSLNPMQLSELVHLFHIYAPDDLLMELSSDTELYGSDGPHFQDQESEYETQAEIALIGLSGRIRRAVGYGRRRRAAGNERGPGTAELEKGHAAVLLQLFRIFTLYKGFNERFYAHMEECGMSYVRSALIPIEHRAELATLLREVSMRLHDVDKRRPSVLRDILQEWMKLLERRPSTRARLQLKSRRGSANVS